LEENLVDKATTAQTIEELKGEINILRNLEQQAKDVVSSGQDRKWEELSRILQGDANMKDSNGMMRKLIIFSEYRDTLNYLHQRIGDVLGNRNAIAIIHGGIHRDERIKVQALFRSDPDVRILIATDAAGEGVNLQNANLMVNYDLPWNPNRLEQRFGRIHRIGQYEVCHLWNLVANETREGSVYFHLLQKLESESAALNGRVFDILGEVFENVSLKELLLQAILYGDQPEVRDRLNQKIDNALDQEHIREILNRNALATESMSMERLFSVKEEMEKAEARKLQPFFIRSFFMKAFTDLGGSIHKREKDRFEITHVPQSIRDRDRLIAGRNRRDPYPVLKRYERICFTKEAVMPLDKPGLAFASMIHPGHPLMLAVSDLILEKNSNLLRQGAVLVDPADDGEQVSILFLLTHEIKSGDGTILSKRLQFVRIAEDGSASFAGWAPHLDMIPLSPQDRPLLKNLLDAPWIRADLERRALAFAATAIVPDHYKEIASRHTKQMDKILCAVNERLLAEIKFWSDRWERLNEDKNSGKDVRLNLDNVRHTISDMENRLESRKKELNVMRHVTSSTPIVLGGALIVPIGLLRRLRGEVDSNDNFSADAAARSHIEQLAMDAVRKAEEARGCVVVDVSAQKCGWDITSYPPKRNGGQPDTRHIEVKGRLKGINEITVTRNEILCALNQADKFILAIVLVDENDSVEGPYYISKPFDTEPEWGVTSQTYNLKKLLEKGNCIQ
jgi:hypothetical protein